MNTPTRLPLVAGLLLALAAPLASAQTAPAADSCRPLGSLEQRIVDKADQSMVTLVHFVVRTRNIYQLDVYEVADSLDGLRARAECVKAAQAREAKQLAAAAQPQR